MLLFLDVEQYPSKLKHVAISRFFAFGCQLSPEERSSGIRILEADTFKLHCRQTLTGTVSHQARIFRMNLLQSLLHCKLTYFSRYQVHSSDGTKVGIRGVVVEEHI